MRQFHFSEEEVRTFAQERYHHPHPFVQRKMEVLWLKSQGESHTRIATLAGVSRRTVQRYLDEYLEGGLEALRTLSWQGHSSALDEHQATLEDHFRDNSPQTVAEACARIETLTGVCRKPTQVRKFLKETLGMRFRKVAAMPVPPKKSPDEHALTQAAFLKDGVGA